MSKVDEILEQLREFATDEQKERAEEGGVDEENVIGAPKGTVKDLAKTLGHDQKLANALWKTEVHEARLLAVWVAEPEKATLKSISGWAKDVETWDLADQIARYLVPETKVCLEVIETFTESEELYIKRIGFGSIACSVMHQPEQPSDRIEGWLEKIEAGAADEREDVSKAVLWALVEIGKQDEYWQDAAIVLACELQAESPAAMELGHEAEKTLSELVSVGDRRRLISGNSKTAKNQSNNQQQNSKRRSGGSNNSNNNNNRRGRGQQSGQQSGQNAGNGGNGGDGKKPARRNGRNKRRSRPAAPKPV